MPPGVMSERKDLTQANRHYTKALLVTLQALGVPQKAIGRRLAVSKQLVSFWAKGTRTVQGAQEQEIFGLIIEAATDMKKCQWPDSQKACMWYNTLVVAITDLDEAKLETERAYADWLRDLAKPMLATMRAKLQGNAMAPATRTRLDETGLDESTPARCTDPVPGW